MIAACFAWMCTALGALPALFFKSFNKKVLNVMLGFSAGVMVAASFFSLLSPAITLSVQQNGMTWLVVSFGFLLGGFTLKMTDSMLRHIKSAQRLNPDSRRTVLLVLSVAVHNIPEGLAIGVAFGAFASGMPGATLIGAVMLAMGIGIQNLPEGTAVAVPLMNAGMPRKRAFFFGQLPGAVEPLAAAAGALLTQWIRPVLPIVLAFAAGAMIFVVIDALIPGGSDKEGNTDGKLTLGAMIGFAIMMCLDVALG